MGLNDIISKYRSMAYDELALEVNKTETYEFDTGGKRYTLEASVIWDDKPDGTIRVALFTNQAKKRWWQTDKPVYSALVFKDDSRDD